MLNFNSIFVGTKNLEKMTKFYNEVFQKDPDMKEEGNSGWLVGTAFFALGYHSEVGEKASDPKRILINLESADVKGEFERVSKIGGVEVIKEPYEMGDGFWISTLADPDGNYFQLVSPWDQNK